MGYSEGCSASNSWKLIVVAGRVVESGMDFVSAEQRSRATLSISGLRSSALIWMIGGRDGDKSLAVLRPVPQPSSVMVSGELAGRRANTRSRMPGSSASSSA